MTDYIAIGDIHGMVHVLDALLARLPEDGTLIFLGDYIDRGPNSRAVIERLLDMETQRPCIFLRGNHEAMALDALGDDREARRAWLANGGITTVESYQGPITPDHLDFLRRTIPVYRAPGFIFVHAGLLPGLPPEAMDPKACWWIRDPFLSTDYRWDGLVIHGHTPVPTPEARPNRINIDTGAVFGGALTALLLPECRVLSVHTAQG